MLIGKCSTRWSRRGVSYEQFHLAIIHRVEPFEVMKGTPPELRSLKKIHTDGWEAKSKKETALFLNSLTDFEFIVGIITLYRLMHAIAPIYQQLQKIS